MTAAQRPTEEDVARLGGRRLVEDVAGEQQPAVGQEERPQAAGEAVAPVDQALPDHGEGGDAQAGQGDEVEQDLGQDVRGRGRRAGGGSGPRARLPARRPRGAGATPVGRARPGGDGGHPGGQGRPAGGRRQPRRRRWRRRRAGRPPRRRAGGGRAPGGDGGHAGGQGQAPGAAPGRAGGRGAGGGSAPARRRIAAGVHGDLVDAGDGRPAGQLGPAEGHLADPGQGGGDPGQVEEDEGHQAPRRRRGNAPGGCGLRAKPAPGRRAPAWDVAVIP